MRFIVSQSPSLAAFGLYLLVTTCFTWPGVTQLSTTILGRMGGDNYEHVWYLWWLGQVIFEFAGSPSTIPILNHPIGIYAPLNLTHTPALFLPSILARVTTPVSAFNLALIVAPALNALAMYWLALELTGHRRSAFLGGLLFGFTPHALGHLQAGHLSQITMMGFPLFALYFLRLVQKPTWRNAGFTGVFAFLASSHPSHLAYFILPVSLTILTATRIQLHNRRVWLTLAGAALVAGALLAPFYVPVLASHASITDHATELGGSVTKSMDLASFLTPPPGNPWLPPALRSFAARAVGNVDESHGYIGFVTLLLALLGFCVKRRRVARWAALAGFALLFSLGPLLRLSGDLLTIRIDSGDYPLQLPHAILTQLPLFSWSRTPARFGATMHFSLALLAAYGMAALLAKLRRHHWQWLITGFLCVTAMAERVIIWPFPGTPAWPTHPLRDIASEDYEHVVLNLPDSFTTNNLALYGQTMHQLPILGGNVFRSSRAELDLAFLDALMRPTPTTDIVPVPHHMDRMALLQSYNVGVVVNQHLAENYDPVQREYLIGALGEPYAISASETIFRIHGTATTLPRLTFALHPDEWQPMEQWGTAPARWFKDSARIYLHNPHQEAGRLQFTLIPGQKLHRVQISVNGSHLTTVIAGDWATYATPNVTLPAGLSTITFTDLDGSEEVWGDLRCVGITPLAGQLPQSLDCDPHLKGQRRQSVAVQAFAWQPHLDETPVAQFGQSIALEYVSWQDSISSSDYVEITINARSLERIDNDLVVFVHVLNQDGVLLSQWDDAPLRGQFATSDWDLDQQLGFRVKVPIPTASLPGNYQLELGWYHPATGSRLPISATVMDTHDNVLVLGSFAIRE